MESESFPASNGRRPNQTQGLKGEIELDLRPHQPELTS